MSDPPAPLDLGTLTVAPKRSLLRVLVMDASRHPIQGAIVTLSISDPPVAVRTGRTGLMEHPLYDLTGFTIDVAAEGFAPARRRISTDELPPRVEFTLRPER
jgi:hypothetical protein